MNSLSKICKDLIIEQPFYGLVLLNLQKEFSTKLPTAGVGINGINFKMLINPDFWKSLTEDQKKGLILHELGHIVYFHLTEFNHLKNKELANIAKDIEINQKIDRKLLPESGCFLEDFAKYGLQPHEGTNIYYRKLMDNEDEQDIQNIMQESQSQGQGNEPSKVQLESGKELEVPNHNWDTESLSEAEIKLIEKQTAVVLNEAIEQVKKTKGDYPRDVEIKIKKILNIEPPKFNWRAYLKRHVGSSIKTDIKKTKRKKSKRFRHDFGLKIETFSHVLIGIDSSASVSDKEIMEFLGELKHMYKSGHDFTLIFADTQMQEPIKYKPHAELVIKKRGGTDFNPVVDYYHQHKNKFSTLIYLTDGEAPLPDNPVKNMLWVLSTISNDADHLKESGKVIKLN
jgi:predicted metal-dependent peptidase